MERNAAAYRAFLETKVRMAPALGFAIDPAGVHSWLRPHCRLIVPWALEGGRRAIFANFGLHKTSIQLELMRQIGLRHPGEPRLIVHPLGVRQEFKADAQKLGLEVRFIRSDAEIAPGPHIHLTNYESVREGKITPGRFIAASLDEAAVLRSFGSKTYQEFLPLFEGVRYRFVATATPSPNRYKELIHYAGFLGVMDTGQALTRFFQRDSEKAGNLTLYPHKEEEFWLWVHSWAVFIRQPSDLGCSDEGYVLPPLDIRWQEVPSDHAGAGTERDGQGLLLRNTALGVGQAAAEKRDSLPARIARLKEIVAEDPGAHRLIWHDLEAERLAIEAAIPGAVSIHGGMGIDERERRVIAFSEGQIGTFATKPILSGAGCNFQRHCHHAIFLGVGFKFHDFIQAVHRIQRFGQAHPCRIDIIHSEAEREVVRELRAKWARHEAMMAKMGALIRAYGLNHGPAEAALKRSIGVNRREVAGERFLVAHNDCVEEARRQPENAVDLIVTSIPFANHYEYTPSYNDFGHTEDNGQFWAQMDFLTPELHRILRPGRLACIHVKDRILFGAVTGAGAPTVSPFHAEAIMHYRAHGFDFMGMVTVVTDVVRENNQTYRLGYSEMVKDGTKMGVGSPEYVLLMRRPQSDRGRGYADIPVVKDKARYSLARWQLDAHAFWRSSGDRLSSPAEMAAALRGLGMDKITAVMRRFSAAEVYDHAYMVRLGELLGDRLPKTFMALGPASPDPDVWTNVNRMLTLNGAQSARAVEKHVCPLQFDIVDRLIERYSNAGELVYDPFGGLMTVPLRALKLGRRGQASELSAAYFDDGVHYLREAERGLATPSLFDLLDSGASEAA